MVVPSLKSHVSSELLPSEWLAMKCQMRVQMEGWLRVRGMERQSFTLLDPKELKLHWPVTGFPMKMEFYYRLWIFLWGIIIYGHCSNTCIFHSGAQLWIWIDKYDFTLSIFLINTAAFHVLVGVWLHYDHFECHIFESGAALTCCIGFATAGW